MDSKRKDDHVKLARDQQNTIVGNDFDHLSFLHHALPAVNPDKISLGVAIGDIVLNHPIYINAMTGGSELTGALNRSLAQAAAATGTAIASGSMSILFKSNNKSLQESFRVLRTENPGGTVFANLSANASIDQAKFVVELLEANALQIHLNAVQETVMPEGDRDFSQWLDNIAKLVENSPVPIIVKEVGFGLSKRTLQQLISVGVKFADLSGSGGTNFALIENSRRTSSDFSYLANWGISTPKALLEYQNSGLGISALASGGIRNPLDVVKALALGAGAVGVSGSFLKTVSETGADGLNKKIFDWLSQIKQIFALLGVKNSRELLDTDLLLSGPLHEYCQLRGITASKYSSRSGY